MAQLTKPRMLAMKAEMFGGEKSEGPEQCSEERVFELLKGRYESEIKVLEGMKSCEEKLKEEPDCTDEKTREIILLTIKNKGHYVSLLTSDFHWWSSAGKIEWENYHEQVTAVVNQANKNE